MEDPEVPLEASVEHMDAKSTVKIAQFQLIYSIAGLVLVLFCVVGGLVLFIRGIGGASG